MWKLGLAALALTVAGIGMMLSKTLIDSISAGRFATVMLACVVMALGALVFAWYCCPLSTLPGTLGVDGSQWSGARGLASMAHESAPVSTMRRSRLRERIRGTLAFRRVEVSSAMRMMHLVAVACLVLTGDAANLSARCEPPPPLCEGAARADLVFYGEVLEETTYVEQTESGPLPQGIQALRFNVIRAFKGVPPSEWRGLFYFGVEARSFKQRARYLVFAHRRATGAFVTGCTPTREMGTADEEPWLRTGAVELDACFKARR